MRGSRCPRIMVYLMGSEVFFLKNTNLLKLFAVFITFQPLQNITRCFKVNQVHSSKEMSCTFLEIFQNWVKLYTLHMMLTTVASATASVSNKLGLMLT